MNSNPTIKQEASPAAILVAQLISDWKGDEASDSEEESGPPMGLHFQPEEVNVNHQSLPQQVRGTTRCVNVIHEKVIG